MAVTFKQLLNRALRVTGEQEIPDATTSLSDTNHLLIAELANDMLEEVQEAHNWRALRQRVTVALASVNTAVITEANETSRIVRIQDQFHGQMIPLAFDITDASEAHPLREMDLPELLYRRTIDPDTTGDPEFFALDNTASGVLSIQVHPLPDTTRTIQLDLIIPQDRLDGTQAADLATNILVPVRPVYMKLVRYILEERGEELGINSLWSEEKADLALQDLIARDVAEQGGLDLVPA